jgi:hypothetical protein
MSSDLLALVLDTLLPGDDGATPLPSASHAEIDFGALDSVARPVLEKLDARVVAASAAERVAALRGVEQAAPEEFRRFLDRVLAAYYQAPDVLASFGWRSEAPQPLGHSLAKDDGETLALLDQVRKRGALWRW